MPGVQLVWDNWERSAWMRDSMKRHAYAGATWDSIFRSAMGKVFFDADGKPGVLYSGKVGLRARAEIENNRGKMWHCSDAHLKLYLDWGAFKYREPFEGPEPVHGRPATMYYPPLRVEGMDHGDEDYFAKADLNGHRVCFNYMRLQRTAEAFAERGWTSDSNGVEMLVWATGAIMLHEILHNHGLSHPNSPNYIAGSNYACSLPYVAERAVLRCSPYWKTFEKYYDDPGGFWLASGGGLSCWCKIK